MTTTLTIPPVTDAAVADLVLVRMTLPGKNPVGPKDVREDVGKLLGVDFSVSQLDDVRNELAAAGFLTKGKRHTFTLTDAGRERALRFLGVDELPPRTNWSSVIGRYLFPKAAGLSADAAAKLDSGDKLAAFILKRKYELAGRAGSTVSQVLEAVACKELGFSGETTLNGLLCVVLSRLMGSERLDERQARQAASAVRDRPGGRQGRCRAEQDRARLAGRRADRRRNRMNRSPAEPFDLTAFAATVRALAAGARPRIGSTTTRYSSRLCGGQASGSRTSRAFRCLSSKSDWSRRTRRTCFT